MKRAFYISAVLAMVFMAGACTDKGNGSDTPATKTRDLELTVNLSPLSKAIMDASGALMWKSGDRIGIWDGTLLREVTVKAADIVGDSRSATVSVTVSSSADNLIVVFPFDPEDSFEGNDLITNSSRVEVGSELREQVKAVGSCPVANPQVTLANFNSIIKFNILSDEVKGVSLSGNLDETLYRRSRINLAGSNLSATPESSDYKRLYLTDLRGKGTYYIGLLPGVKFARGYTIKFFNKVSMSSSAHIGTYTTTSPAELKSGSFLDLGTLEFTPPEKIPYSNCYVVTAPGTYQIVPVKGNSEKSIGMVSSADVIWETVNTATAPQVGTVISGVSFNADKNVIEYTATAVPGNALIAARDSEGNIIWSWHIWNAQQELQEITLGNGRVVLDRNLGALSPEAAGMMFQWGRKDPFMGASAPNSGGTALIQATAPVNNGSPVQSSETVGTMEYTILNPAQWIQSVAASAWDWYYQKFGDGFWGTEKTVYDPCPFGYRVADTSVLTGIDKLAWPLSGRLSGTGKAWNITPGSETYYWAANAPGGGNTTANSLCIGTSGDCSVVKTTRGLGCPVRCEVDTSL